MHTPSIIQFYVKSYHPNLLTLAWEVENAHHVEILELGPIVSVNEIELNRAPNRNYEFTLKAVNLVSKIETTKQIKVYPAPICNSFSYDYLPKNKIQLNWDCQNTEQVVLNGFGLQKTNSILIPNSSPSEQKFTLILEGKNQGEKLEKHITINPKKNNSKWKLGVALAASLLFICFLGAVLTCNGPKEKNLINSAQNLLHKEINCPLEGKDKLANLKSILVESFKELNILDLDSRTSMVQCLENAFPKCEYLLVVASEKGNDYHPLKDYILKENPLAVNIESFEVKQNGKAGISKLKVYASVLENQPTLIIKSKEQSSNTKAIVSSIPAPISTLYQGEVLNRMRRLQIEKQWQEGEYWHFRYSIIGLGAEQHKEGKLNLKTGQIDLETFGKGQCNWNNGVFTWEFPTENILLKSIN